MIDDANSINPIGTAAVYVIYHGNCPDGFTAAWVAWTKFGMHAVYIPATYGQPIPAIPDGSEVYILDFSYPRDDLTALHARCKLMVLDHHASAEAMLAGLPFARFDMTKSGARLAWEYWNAEDEPPALLRYVEDRDLWRWSLSASREVAAALKTYPMDFETWANLMAAPIKDVASEGITALRLQDATVTMMARQARWTVIEGYEVPVVNAAAFWSEVADMLLYRESDALFAAAYFDRADGRRQWSLRSRPGFDVSEIAAVFGGGGHPQAAGFTTSSPGALPFWSEGADR